MNEQELRSLVRDAVARHLGGGGPPVARVDSLGTHSVHTEPAQPLRLLSSHSLYAGLVNIGDACVIEPAVSCDHCGYCKSHGH